jgi:ribose-phosphate pyrophosphokinase
MEPIIFSLPGNEQLALALSGKANINTGSVEIRNFPDGETYIRFDTAVQDKYVFLVCCLDQPNDKVLPLLFMAQTAKRLGAIKICLITPYLPYMRQDKEFKHGEAVTSVLFANCLSSGIDCLVTIDPHLHRIHRLSEIYSIPQIHTLHSIECMSTWIINNIKSPYIIGPDEESRQWVSEVARLTQAGFVIMQKTRYGDKNVEISIPAFDASGKTPVFVDDIISTGTSILTAIRQLEVRNISNPVCVCVHALFGRSIYENLLGAGARKIVSCNTIPHFTNEIDITDLIANQMKQILDDQLA